MTQKLQFKKTKGKKENRRMENSKQNNKMKKKCCLIVAVCIILAIIVMVGICCQKQSYTLIQLSPQSGRQMMGYLLKTDTGKLIVIDGGTREDTNQLEEQIKQNGGTVDTWFLTHAHDDHVGAFTEIMKKDEIEVKTIYVSTNPLEWYQKNEPERADFTETFLNTLEKVKEKVVEPSVNQIIHIDDVQVEVLGIKNPEITENAGNEQSMVIKFTIGKKSLLILGDTGVKSSQKLLHAQREKLKSDFVQMAHHGQAGATKELYQEVKPDACLWPAPKWLWENDAGTGRGTGPWKSLETREWMEELQVKKHYVAKDGNLKIEIRE